MGQKVAAIRRRRGLTLDGLAELSSVSRASISALENGADNPRVQTLWNIADALGVNFGTLIEDNGDERVTEEDGVSVKLVDRQTNPRIVEVYLLELPAGVSRNAKPHATRVFEHVVVLAGEVLAGPSEGPSLLKSGQSVSFAADVPHVYSAGRSVGRAIVTVVYPRLEEGTRPDQELSWPQSRADWEAVDLLLARATIEVQNGLDINAKTFQLPPHISAEKAVSELRKRVSALPPSRAVRRFVVDDDAPGVLSLYRTPQLTPLQFEARALNSDLGKRCLQLARLASEPAAAYELDQIARTAAGTLFLTESALAAEILTRAGRATVPLGVGTVKYARETPDPDAARLFEARIDVDAYEAYELVHPAYARQTLALAGNLPAKPGLRILDVGTGPGLPLAMLRELRPDLIAVAVDPSPVAIQHLQQRFKSDPSVTIHQASITEMEQDDEKFEAVVSIGASHHLNTSDFLSSIRTQIKNGGRLLIADEMICSFGNRDEREAALIRHHLWYILDTLIQPPKESDKGDLLVAKRLAEVLPQAMGMAYAGRSKAAVRLIRDILEEVMAIERPLQPSNPLVVFSRFHLLELQALTAGFDYEVEQKTSARRFKSLARANGFHMVNHQRIYATDGDDLDDAGTHLLVLEAI